MTTQNILVLGAGGFIGAHLTERLLAENYDVRAVDTHHDKLQDCLTHPRLTWIEGDIRDRSLPFEDWIKEADLVVDRMRPALGTRDDMVDMKGSFLRALRK